MTGLLGGGHGIHLDAGAGEARLLDFFVDVPGLGAPPGPHELLHLDVPFGAELVHYAVGIASCAVPGVTAGLGELHRAHGRLPWPRLVEPALALAGAGVELPPAHAACLEMLAPVLTMDAGARIYAPGGRLLAAGERLEQPGLVTALELLAEEGPGTFHRGTGAESLLALAADRGGLVTRADLEAYEPRWAEPARGAYLGTEVLGRGGLPGVIPALAALPPLAGRGEPARAVALVAALGAARGAGHTSNLVTVDRDGNACVLTTSLGLGSGDVLPGLDVHLNSMLGEADLLVGPLEPGRRMASMMAPTLVLDGEGLAAAGGAAGGTRLRSALVQVLQGVLDEGLHPQEAIDRPRLHPAGGTIHLEPGWSPEAVDALSQAGAVEVWPGRHHYFGGVSVIARRGAGADPRRSGLALAAGR